MSRPVEFTSGGNCSTRSKIRSDAFSRPSTVGALRFADNVAPDHERIHAGAEEALDRLFRLAMWLERNRAEAEDLVQETLAQALQSFHRYTPGTNCRAWLITILQRVRANRRRALGRLPIDSDIEERAANTVAFVPPIPDSLTDEELLGALDSIPPHQQASIEELFTIPGWSAS